MRALLDLSPEELQTWLQAQGQPAMRLRQLRRWIIAGRAESFDQMTDLPHDLRQALTAEFVPLGTCIEHHSEARDGTHKLMIRLQDDELVECVLIQEHDRRTACISTQVGCGMGCVFCASGLNGVMRNLSAGEILEQLIRLRNLLPPLSPPSQGGVKGGRLTNIVVMGMGEPLANLDNLIEALDVACAKDGLGIGARHVTISTVGLPAKMRRLADLTKSYHLAVSLHAPTDALRTRIVPTNTKTGLDAILAAADYYFERNGRRVTYEYVLLHGINDAIEHARELAELLRSRCAHVNLIPFNDVEGLPYRRPTQETLTAFGAQLRRAGISVKVRKRKGSAIAAACGQLRRRFAGAVPSSSGSEPEPATVVGV